MDFTTQGGKIYRPRPKAEVCKFLPPRVVKSIDDRADICQCYSHLRYYMKKSQANGLPFSHKVFIPLQISVKHLNFTFLHSFFIIFRSSLFISTERTLAG